MLKFLQSKVKKRNKKESLETDALADYPSNSNRSQSHLPDNGCRQSDEIRVESTTHSNIRQNPDFRPSVPSSMDCSPSSTYSSSPVPLISGYTPPISIVINNANGFHIGDAVHVSMSDHSTFNLSGPGVGTGLSGLGQSLRKKISESDKIVPDLEEKVDVLTDTDITVIAQNLNDWKAFGRGLTITDCDLDSLEIKFSDNSYSACMEMLHSFMSLYPDTSLGFVASVLKESGQINALQMLAKTQR